MLEATLNNLKKLYQQEYGVAVFSIDLKKTKKGIELKGEVLTKSQRNDIINALKKSKKNIIKENIKVLANAGQRNEIDWAVVKVRSTDLKSRFVSNKILNEKILKRIRCSQALKGEILRVLYKNEDQLLVQQNDLTLGWVNRNDVVLKRKSLYKKWASVDFAVKGKIIKISKVNCHSKQCHPRTEFGTSSEFISGSIKNLGKNNLKLNRRKILKQVQNDSLDKIIKEAEKYLNTRYVLGGKLKGGIDCSGLTQAVYKNALNIILPRHSWDQKEVGKKVKLENLKTGDLIFLIKEKNSHKHVGIVEVIKSPQFRVLGTAAGRNINLIHASLDEKKVIRQDLDKVFEKYEFVEARRIVG
jgi:hypothetical protein